MSTNYNILLKSEKLLKKSVVEYLELVNKIHTKLWIELNNDESYIAFDNAEKRVKQAYLMEDDLIDECVWTISKDGPRTNHLRYIISIIYCAKDLTRACEYAQSIAKIVIRKKIERKHLKLLKPIIDLYLETINKIIKLYNSLIEDKLEKIDDLYLQFEIKLEENERIIREEFKGKDITYLYISQITRLINSVIERIKSVFPSTIFVKSATTTISTSKSKK